MRIILGAKRTRLNQHYVPEQFKANDITNRAVALWNLSSKELLIIVKMMVAEHLRLKVTSAGHYFSR